ncbi:alpha-glucosidase [Anaeramoeba ignava]|uniref:Alpha-glucosidase n=1 Tax=Anaeramoeba ignava TaxID=1746090 RepID=A0A9Q0LTT5_ANAIG|nr:alpha-glucosidase [Anaeramoeba ignava]
MKKFIAFIGLLFLIYNSFADESTYYPGYSLSNVQQNSGGFTGDLTMISPGPYGDDIPNLSLNVEYQTETRVRIKIYDPNNARWEVPDVIQNSTNPIPTKMEYKVEYTTNPFGIAVIRELNNEVLFNTTPPKSNKFHDYNGLIFENLYIEINSKTAKNPNIYGLGKNL